jgi:hypothetical protein
VTDDLDTLRPPSDTLELLRELRAALEHTSELCVKVAAKLTRVEIAQLTSEHRQNVQRDRLDALEIRLAEVVQMLPPPPEAA